jgi:uncharacterized protein YndB with AHSA1/START domain
MRGPNGTIYPMSGEFTEVQEPERLAYTSSALDERGQPLFVVLTTLSFSEQGGKTQLDLRARVISLTVAAAPYLAGMEPGLNQTLDRLAEYVITIKEDL